MLKVIGASWFQTRVGTCIVGAVSALGILAIILGEMDKEYDDGVYSATVFWGENTGFHIDFWGQGNEMEEIPYGVGRAYYKQEIDATGWAVLEVETRSEYPDWVQAYSAGLLEGSLTWQLIYWHWQNTVENVCQDRQEFCQHVYSFIEENSELVKGIAERRGDRDPFWHQVQLFYIQLDGLETGWRYGVKRSRQDIEISELDFLWMNMVSDLADMERQFSTPINGTQPSLMFSAAASFASAFVKYHKESGELYAVHNSGGLYQSMLRVLKRYQLGYHHTSDPNSKLVQGQVITFSSYPGVIHSQDDFYLVMGEGEFGKKPHQLAVLGTAFSNHSRTSVLNAEPTEQVLIGPRVMAANRLARDGRFWGRYLARADSGTGSKQWLVVNYGQITESTSADKGLLWVVEQTFGLTHSVDQTNALQRTGIWVSTAHQDVLETGKLALFDKYQSQSEGTHPHNITSILQLMRNNSFLSNYHSVPQNKSSPSFSLQHPPMGTIDSKIFMTSPKKKLELYVISGPPVISVENNQNNTSKNIDVPFQWSKSQFANETHVGLPDLWHFNPMQPKWFWA
ncbi:putative phospholipase B-like lamina ancestor isoform X1 [Periplaneta americana]|uniref:putative phospholipase B-like lamina ancestor isoform X1 n=1 Tax=Periplaneta americana TaxID=6978 RepID=UPI0037E79CFB